jgi:D-alanyl-D-alanine-carboxypeptidase/D-alanyl-D-alanine-endopeptidase
LTLDQIGAPVRRHLSIAITLCALLQGCTASEPQHAFPNNSDLELMLRFLVEDGEARDIVLGVLESDGSTRIVSFGGATEGSLPLDGESSFEIGSLTKVFTTTVLAEMAERGEVALDDPVSTYLPSEAHVPTFGDRPITLEDLATHTSGLSDATMLEQLPALGVVDPFSVTVETMYALLSNYSLQRKPGDAFEYSNFGMGLLGHALAQAAGMDLPSLVKERILDPLGMSDTHYGLEGTPAERLVQGYYGDQAAAPIVASEALEGAGGLRSTAADMLRFLAANVGAPDTDLTRAMQDAQVPRRPMGAGNRRVGLGWWTYTLNRRPLIQHDGDTDGFTARMAFDPARRIGMVLSTNSREFDNSLVPDLLVHDPIAPPEKEGVPVADLTGLTGTYLIDFIPWYVRLDEGGFLTVQPTTDVRMRLYAASDTLFFTKREEWSFAFPTDTVGESPDLVMYVNGRPHSGIRIDAESPPARTIAGNLGLPLDRAMAARYEGTYDVPVGSQTLELTIYWAESTGRLMTNFAGTVSRLIPMGADAFTVVYNPSIRVAFTLRDGRAEEVTLSQGGRSDSGVRRK